MNVYAWKDNVWFSRGASGLIASQFLNEANRGLICVRNVHIHIFLSIICYTALTTRNTLFSGTSIFYFLSDFKSFGPITRQLTGLGEIRDNLSVLCASKHFIVRKVYGDR